MPGLGLGFDASVTDVSSRNGVCPHLNLITTRPRPRELTRCLFLLQHCALHERLPTTRPAGWPPDFSLLLAVALRVLDLHSPRCAHEAMRKLSMHISGVLGLLMDRSETDVRTCMTGLVVEEEH